MLKRIACLLGMAMVFGLGYFLGGYQSMDPGPSDAHAANWYIEPITCPKYSISCEKDMGRKYVKITLENKTITSVSKTGTGARVYFK